MGLAIALIIFRATVGDLRLLVAYLYDDAVVFRSGNGDILFWQSEFIRPLQNPDNILSVHRYQTDEQGFRLPAQPHDTYRVVALGDSYTEAINVARPWPDVFASKSGLSTRNLGFRGYGLAHYAWTWQQYGQTENPDVVIVGFFGANDVFTAGLGDQPPFPPPSSQNPEDIDLSLITDHDELGENLRIYPMTVNEEHPITFLNSYISWMNIAEDQLTGSVNYRVIADHLSQIRATTPQDTCLIFAYFPSKPEVYFSHLNREDQNIIINRQKTPLINSDGTLHLVEDFTINLDRVLEWRWNTSRIFTDLADDLGYEALNLHPVFDEHAAQGEMLYYTYDTHWNQAGQTLAGETLAEFVTTRCDSINT